MPFLEGLVGAIQALSDGSQTKGRFDRQGGLVVSELHGRFYEQNFRGNVYMGGMTLTSLASALFNISATTDATAKPITGVYNPVSSGVNLVIIQAYLGVTMTVATNTGGGPYVWAASGPNEAISTGTVPTNAKTLTKQSPSGASSVAKDMSGIALTGLVAALTVKRASSLSGGSSANFSFVGTAAGQATTQTTSVENIDGLLIVPPGCVLGLFQTSTAVAHSAASGIVWEEVPI